jgi:CubicO group peptidase (beta-lactamase class C family)
VLAWALSLGCGGTRREAVPVRGTPSGAADFGDEGTGSTGGWKPDGSSETGSSDDLPPEVVEAIDACMTDLVASPTLSGGAAAVVHGGETVWIQGFGVRHPDRSEPVDVDTRFRVGSVTKVMTAATAMTLVAEDALELDAPIGDTLPPFGDPAHPEYTTALTLRQLLSQQGGFYDHLTIDGPRGDDALADAVLGEVFSEIPFLVEPGKFYNYSNPNYSLAGLLVERAVGRPYRHAVEDRLFGPLQMTRSTFDVEAVEADGNYAHGVVDGGVFDARAFDNGWGRPAGFAWSSARDLARLVGFLQHGDSDVLPRWAHAELLRPQVDTLAVLDRVRYGLGLRHSDFIPVEDGFLEYDNIEHDGSLPGYSALVHLAPELDLGLAFVANGNDVNFYPCIEAALAEIPWFDATPTLLDLQVEHTDADAFVGDWVEPLAIVGDFSIARSDRGGLEVSFPQLDRAGISYLPDLIPVTLDNFHLIIDGFPVLLTGIFDDTGELTHLRTRLFVAHPGLIAPHALRGQSPAARRKASISAHADGMSLWPAS